MAVATAYIYILLSSVTPPHKSSADTKVEVIGKLIFCPLEYQRRHVN